MNNLVIVRGGGDLATGTIYKLKRCGFPVLVLETANPAAIRRTVAFSEAVFQGYQTVEGITCYLAVSLEEAGRFLQEGKLTMLVDPMGESIAELKPLAVVDAILAKKNLGTNREMAPITIGLGPGFTAGCDVDAVIETKRGHGLGMVLRNGSAAVNTGVPGCGFQRRYDCGCGNAAGDSSCGSNSGWHCQGSDPGWLSRVQGIQNCRY